MTNETALFDTERRLAPAEQQTYAVSLDRMTGSQASHDLAALSAQQLQLSPPNERLRLQNDPVMEFALSVARGLSDLPRRLESRFLYDAQGSDIFESICLQPEYYLTRTETAILAAAADDIAATTGEITLIELGSGSSIKTRLLLEAYAARFGQIRYSPVDVSRSILDQAERQINCLHPMVSVKAVHGTFEDAFPLMAAMSPAMILFLGSTLGNLDSAESAGFWNNVTSHLLPGDFCLLGVDINEDPASLHAAYNDAGGYSASFTRNLFERMNRELGAAVDPSTVDHIASYEPQWRRIEIFARFRQAQTIRISPLNSDFNVAAGEIILTEVSRKFRLKQLVPYLGTFGLKAVQIFRDSHERFAVLLLRKI